MLCSGDLAELRGTKGGLPFDHSLRTDFVTVPGIRNASTQKGTFFTSLINPKPFRPVRVSSMELSTTS